MAEIDNVVVVQFPDASKAYQALSVLKECDAEGRIGLKSAAIVERTPCGDSGNRGLAESRISRVPDAVWPAEG
jgi:uncharacterized membrane protein